MTDTQLMTFRDMLRTFEQPEKWELRVIPINGTLGEARAISLPPRVEGLQVEVWAACNGCTPGEYRLHLEPISDNEHTAKAARNRQRKRGPLTESVTITEQHTVEAQDVRRNAEAANAEKAARKSEHMRRLNGAPPRTASGKPDDALEQVRRATEIARAEAERATAELALRKARRELDREEEGRSRGEPREASSPGWLAALVPLASTIIDKFLASSERREKLIAEAMATRSESPSFSIAPEAPPVVQQGLTLDSLASLIPTIKDLFAMFRDLGGSDTGEPRSQFGDIAELVKALAPALTAPTQAPAPTNRVAKLQPVHATAEDPQMNLGKMRVIGWLSKVQREAAVPSDPQWAANVLALSEQPPAPFGALPTEFQELVLQNSPEGVVAGLSRWMPAPAFTALQGHLQGSEPARRWLAEFIIAIQEGLATFDEDEEATEEELEDIPEPPTRNGAP